MCLLDKKTREKNGTGCCLSNNWSPREQALDDTAALNKR